MTEVAESTPYESFSHLVENEPPPQSNDPRIKQEKDYPLTLKVHINERQDCDAFAGLLGRDLSSDDTKLLFNKNAKRKTGAKYTELRLDPSKRKTTHLTRDESVIWGKTTDFVNDELPTYQTFEITITDAKNHVALLRLLKQQLAFQTPSTYFPKVEKTVSKGKVAPTCFLVGHRSFAKPSAQKSAAPKTTLEKSLCILSAESHFKAKVRFRGHLNSWKSMIFNRRFAASLRQVQISQPQHS
mgnify:CR=1 FL=1